MEHFPLNSNCLKITLHRWLLGCVLMTSFLFVCLFFLFHSINPLKYSRERKEQQIGFRWWEASSSSVQGTLVLNSSGPLFPQVGHLAIGPSAVFTARWGSGEPAAREGWGRRCLAPSEPGQARKDALHLSPFLPGLLHCVINQLRPSTHGNEIENTVGDKDTRGECFEYLKKMFKKDCKYNHAKLS